MVGGRDFNFVNIKIDELKKVAIKSIINDEVGWVAVDMMGYDESRSLV